MRKALALRLIRLAHFIYPPRVTEHVCTEGCIDAKAKRLAEFERLVSRGCDDDAFVSAKHLLDSKVMQDRFQRGEPLEGID